MFSCEIKTDGAAFRNPENGEENEFYEGLELKRIFRKIENDINHGATSGVIMDLNGNKVGSWKR